MIVHLLTYEKVCWVIYMMLAFSWCVSLFGLTLYDCATRMPRKQYRGLLLTLVFVSETLVLSISLVALFPWIHLASTGLGWGIWVMLGVIFGNFLLAWCLRRAALSRLDT